MNVRVSVIIPMFNAGWCVEESLSSVEHQSLREFEAIVVNDGSTDDSSSIARGVARRDPRFRVIDQANAGLAAARNTGLEAATGEYVYFLDADDRAMPWSLEILVERASRWNARAVYARHELRDPAGRASGWAPMIDPLMVDHARLLRGCVFPVMAQLIRRDAVGDVRFDPSLRVGEDWDFWLRLSERGVTWRGIDRVVAAYRLSPGSLSRDVDGMWRSLAVTLAWAHLRAGTNRDERESALDELALEWATAAAGAGDAGAGAALLRRAGVRGRIDPRAAALKAFHRLSWTRGLSPTCWRDPGAELLVTVTAFWDRLENEGMAAPGFTGEALRSLAELSATDALVANTIAGLCDTARPVVLYGLGRNARYVADALRRRGVVAKGADDALESPPDWWEDLGLDSELRRPGELRASDQVVLTMTEDGGVPGRLPAGVAPAARWSQVRRELAGRQLGTWKAQQDGFARAIADTGGFAVRTPGFSR